MHHLLNLFATTGNIIMTSMKVITQQMVQFFENLVILSLARNGINPIYYQTELTYVPSAIFDVFFIL